MADTQRTRAALLALLADNVTANISPQDHRDSLVTIMETEFANPGDFWKQPDPAQISSDEIRGWIEYSVVFDSGVSFGNVVKLTPSGTYRPACASTSAATPAIGVAADSYASGASGNILRMGLIYHSVFSGDFSGFKGSPVYLQSANSLGSITVTAPTNIQRLGIIEDDTKGIWRFVPDSWAVLGT